MDIGNRYVDGQYTPTPSPLPPDLTPDGYVHRRVDDFLAHSPTDKPLFLCASFPGPHSPLDAPGDHARGYRPPFDRMNMTFPADDPATRKRIIIDRLREVHR